MYVCLFQQVLENVLTQYPDDTGVISATLVSIKDSLGHPLTTGDESFITAATALFALLISPISGVIADSLGRKRVVLLADAAFILGAILQAVSASVPTMIAGRSIVGLAVGAGSFVTPLYIAELAPSPFRGRLVTLNVLFVTLGQVIAYIVGWIFVEWGNVNTGWRWIVGLGAVPAVIQGIVMLVMPETPRWLVMVGRRDEARKVLNKVFGAGIDVQNMVDTVLKGIEREVREEEEAKRGRMHGQRRKVLNTWLFNAKDTWAELFAVGGNRRALIIACLLQGLQQLCGFVGSTTSLQFVLLTFKLQELVDVLFRHYLHNNRLRKSNINLSVGSNDELYHDLCGPTTNRPRGEKTYPPLLTSNHGNWPSILQSWIYLHHITAKFQPGKSFLDSICA